MPLQDPPSSDPLAYTRQPRSVVASSREEESPTQNTAGKSRVGRWLGIAAFTLCVLAIAALIAGRLWLRHTMESALPQIDGSLAVSGLSAPVTVVRDARGTPTIHAASVEDLIFAQGYVTAQDRLFQMDSLRRHAAGELSEILGSALLQHDRTERILQLRATADAAVAQLPPEQLRWLEIYARGVNAAVAAMGDHLPFEFRVLKYTPKPWTPRDSLLVSLAMFQDLTNRFPEKLNREALTARLATGASPDLRAQLLSDLYPVGSWRDHPPSQTLPDLTAPVDEIPEIPLDNSQTMLQQKPAADLTDLLALTRSLAPSLCSGCAAGSNNWVVSGAHTASGQPLLSNDMHLGF